MATSNFDRVECAASFADDAYSLLIQAYNQRIKFTMWPKWLPRSWLLLMPCNSAWAAFFSRREIWSSVHWYLNRFVGARATWLETMVALSIRHDVFEFEVKTLALVYSDGHNNMWALEIIAAERSLDIGVFASDWFQRKYLLSLSYTIISVLHWPTQPACRLPNRHCNSPDLRQSHLYSPLASARRLVAIHSWQHDARREDQRCLHCYTH